jgi:hypothetical protein
MAGDNTPHIEVSYMEGATTTITKIFAVSEETLQEAQFLAVQKRFSSAVMLSEWLESKKCLLDCSKGPAYIRRLHLSSDSNKSYATYEAYLRYGKLYRENGNVAVCRGASGSESEPLSNSISGVTVERPAPPSPPKAPEKPAAPGPS